MDDKMSPTELDHFLEEVGSYYEYEDLFDFSEDKIPLSRLVNKIVLDIIKGKDGFIINENGVKTLLLKTNLIPN